MLADSLGRPLRFILMPGQSGDVLSAPALLEGSTADAVLADKAYDSNAFRQAAANTGAKAIACSPRRARVTGARSDEL